MFDIDLSDREICESLRKARAAIYALENIGYIYKGKKWKPPVAHKMNQNLLMAADPEGIERNILADLLSRENCPLRYILMNPRKRLFDECEGCRRNFARVDCWLKWVRLESDKHVQ